MSRYVKPFVPLAVPVPLSLPELCPCVVHDARTQLRQIAMLLALRWQRFLADVLARAIARKTAQ